MTVTRCLPVALALVLLACAAPVDGDGAYEACIRGRCMPACDS